MNRKNRKKAHPLMDGHKPAITPNGTFHHLINLIQADGYVNHKNRIFFEVLKNVGRWQVSDQ